MITAIVIFVLAAAMAGLAIWLFVYADRRDQQEEMLLRLKAGDAPGGASFRTLESRLRNPVLRAACHLVWRTGSALKPETVKKILWILAAMVPLTLMLFGWALGLAVTAGALALGVAVLRHRAARRRALIGQQLPGFLEAAMRVLQVGNTMEESIATAAVDSPEPLRPLFQSVGRQVRLGAPLDQVLAETAEIHGIRSIKVVALAAAINRKYGGSLRNMFRSLIGTIRARDSAVRELRALTAETRFSAVVLAVIPIVLTAVIFFQNRNYYDAMWESTGGRLTLMFGILMQVAGVIVIYRMMKATQGDE